MLVRSRDHGGRRAYFYACSSFHRRGSSVCAISLSVRVEEADEAILGEIERFVLNPSVIRRAVEITLDAFRAGSDTGAAERVRLERDRRKADSEIANLTAAIAAGGGELPSVLVAIKAAEHRRQTTAARLAKLNQAGAVFTSQTGAELERQVLGKLAEWRATMRREAPEARLVLREVIADRLALAPEERHGKRVYGYRGTFSFGGLFEGLMLGPRALASPISPSWNQMTGWLRAVDSLRRAA
jgi:hypothetical protein